MNISQRLRTCAKHTGLDAVIELLQEAADEIDALQARAQATGEPVAWRNVIPGGRKTDEWESTRIADYNLGWNDYRKAAKTALEHLETSTQPLPSAWMYTLEYGGTIADTKVSLRQLNYPFGVCGADYLRKNSDGISYVRQTPLYTHPAPGVPEFSRIAKRKLDELQEQGFAITGYAIQRGPVRGFIDASGFVGWRQCEPDPGLPDDVARDAERYRWLRDRDHWPAPFASSQDPEPVRGTDLDAAIDAAMIASPAQKGGE